MPRPPSPGAVEPPPPRPADRGHLDAGGRRRMSGLVEGAGLECTAGRRSGGRRRNPACPSFCTRFAPASRVLRGSRWFGFPGPYWSTAAAALVVGRRGADGRSSSCWNRAGGSRWPLLKSVSLIASILVRSSNYRNLMFRAVRDDQSDPPGVRPPATGVRLSVVVPAYREGDRIAPPSPGSVTSWPRWPPKAAWRSWSSTTARPTAPRTAARAAGADRSSSYTAEPGQGGGGARRDAGGPRPTVAFTDADLAYAPARSLGLLEAVEDGWDVVVGSRQHTDTMTVVRAGACREIGGRAINLVTGVVLLGRLPRHPVRAQGVPARRGRAASSRTPGRRLRLRRRGVPPGRALPALAHRGARRGRELRTLDGPRASRDARPPGRATCPRIRNASRAAVDVRARATTGAARRRVRPSERPCRRRTWA